MVLRPRIASAALALLLLASRAASCQVPTPEHVVIVVLENHSYAQIMDGDSARYLHALAAAGANFTQSYALAHPSQPNYFALLSGSTQGARDNGDMDVAAPSLAGALAAAGRSFAGYAERGSPRKHKPWESFADARASGRDFAQFPADPRDLPTVSMVIPNDRNDMHDGSIGEADAWIEGFLGRYAAWCATHPGLLIITFDEDDDRSGNRIPTIFYGAQVKPGRYDERIDHLTVLRTIEAMYGLKPLADSADRAPITDIWRAP